uniref:DNA-(apurinic or apyrimidinic site) endonuclease n=1 Tax=Neobodo designis TaxID=312471 RepID=A0A7S1KWE1_NEODS|mmetsp:Transcript_10276/g.31768  ORF Transcript_10276/g.31768 Transcript_10276/m.31768 type:complete len:369 (+) Transcript_10276:44-1150(+)
MPPKGSKKAAPKKAEAAAAAAPAEADKPAASPKAAKRTKAESGADAKDTTKKADTPVRRQSTGGATVTEEMAYAGTTAFERCTKDGDFDAKSMLRIVSWNVAGLRGFLSRGGDLSKFCATEKPDILCLQETKLSDPADGPKIGAIDGYSHVDSISTAKKGYAGTRTYVRDGLVKVTPVHAFGFNLDKPDDHDDEGRVVTTALPDLGDLTIVNTYVPNSGMTLERLDFRENDFDPMMRRFLKSIPWKDSVVWTGDLNVAERDYDRFWGGNFKQMQKCPGFTPEERASFRTTLKECNMVDAFRHKYPTAAKAGTYTFFSARFNQRAKGNGWRLDYFVVSAALAARVVDCFPLTSYADSDHQPLVLWLKRK